MGNAKIWYYPDASGTVEEIDLGEPLSDLQVETVVDQAVAEGISGHQSTDQYSGRAQIRLIVERFASASTYRALAALREHLRRGGLCAVAEDSVSAWAAFATTIPVRGATSLYTFTAPWPFVAAPTVTAAEVELIGSQPSGLRETLLTSGTFTGNTNQTVTFASGVRFNHSQDGARWLLLRQRGFWPLLRMPIDQRNQSVITDDHRITYTLDVVLEEAIDQYEAWAQTPSDAVQTTTVTGDRRTLEATGQERDDVNTGDLWWGG